MFNRNKVAGTRVAHIRSLSFKTVNILKYTHDQLHCDQLSCRLKWLCIVQFDDHCSQYATMYTSQQLYS